MYNDDTIWDCCGKTFCAYKTKFNNIILCSNKYNITGLCSRKTCPLANGNYATIIEIKGDCYLYLKAAERVNTPSKLWEPIKLPNDAAEAFRIIEKAMAIVYKDYQINLCKLRFNKIQEYLKRKDKLENEERPVLVVDKKKLRRKEDARERKALRVAKITDVVEKELLLRLKQNYYMDIYTINTKEFSDLIEEDNETGIYESDEEMSEDQEIENDDEIEENYEIYKDIEDI